jgi:copper chaperone
MTKHISLYIGDMTLGNCIQDIKSALKKLNGIYDVIVDISTRHVAVEYDEERLDIGTIKGTIEDVGFKVK